MEDKYLKVLKRLGEKWPRDEVPDELRKIVGGWGKWVTEYNKSKKPKDQDRALQELHGVVERAEIISPYTQKSLHQMLEIRMSKRAKKGQPVRVHNDALRG